MNERQIHRAVFDFLVIALPGNAIVWTVPGGDGARTQAPRYRKGTPDILFVCQGRCYAVEVKGPRGTLKPDQAAERCRCINAGVPYAVVRSIDEMQTQLELWGFRSSALALHKVAEYGRRHLNGVRER